MMERIDSLLSPIRRLQEMISSAIVSACEHTAVDDLSGIARDTEGDTIYAVDRIGEELLIEFLEREVAAHTPIVLIAEGLPSAGIVLPRHVAESDAVWRIIIDPIDGTRGLMYQKRSGWVLTGVAPNRGMDTGLQDIELAVQTEIPLVKQHLYDVAWAIKGKGADAERVNRLTGERSPLQLRPSKATSIEQGFASLARFFPGASAALGSIEEEIVFAALGETTPGKARCFEDQYISSGGQLYELMAGHDRFIADLRPLVSKTGLACHPYDLCTELIARELGVVVTDIEGGPLQARLDTLTNVAWVGYANGHIRQQMEPLLQTALEKRGLLIYAE